ncbi:MAG: MBL fold metallo-hydrolase [Chitinophagia bacterium]|jgi:glyoxylase-like metal-dependent hydrolase (beta-lactamase superfamily II)
MLTIQTFCFNAFQENTYVLYDENKEAIIVDPGCYTRIEEKTLTDFIAKNELKPTLLLNTHCHLDHVFGNNFMSETYGLTALLHSNEQIVLDRLPEAAAKYGIPVEAYKGPIQYIQDQEIISFGKEEFKVLLTPGHSPGSVCFYNQKQDFILGGDLIFKDSVGRTDFPGCNPEDLIKSIRNQILPLPDTLSIYAGHGPVTQLGRERKMNPYIKHLLNS